MRRDDKPITSCADIHEIWESQHPGTVRACPGLYRDWFTHMLKKGKDCQFLLLSSRAQPAERALSLFEVFQASMVCPSDRSSEMNMSVEHWWNDIKRGNRNSRRKTCLSATVSPMNRTRNGL